jgi:hypothetical protein
MTKELVILAIEQTNTMRGNPKDLLIHSDRSSRYIYRFKTARHSKQGLGNINLHTTKPCSAENQILLPLPSLCFCSHNLWFDAYSNLNAACYTISVEERLKRLLGFLQRVYNQQVLSIGIFAV